MIKVYNVAESRIELNMANAVVKNRQRCAKEKRGVGENSGIRECCPRAREGGQCCPETLEGHPRCDEKQAKGGDSLSHLSASSWWSTACHFCCRRHARQCCQADVSGFKNSGRLVDLKMLILVTFFSPQNLMDVVGRTQSQYYK